MRLRDVRIESHRRDQGAIGITALVEDGEHTLIQFSLRRWPDDGSAHQLSWTAIDQSRQAELACRGAGLGGGVLPEMGAALDGGIWLEGPTPGPLRIQCLHRNELLIDIDLTGGRLEPAPSPIGNLGLLEADRPRRRQIMRELEAAGWRRGKAIADEVLAINNTRPKNGPFGVTPYAIERWGRLIRIAVSIDESNEPDYPPRWWTVEIGGHTIDALGEHFQSGRTANLIGHLVMVDPTPEQPLHQL